MNTFIRAPFNGNLRVELEKLYITNRSSHLRCSGKKVFFKIVVLSIQLNLCSRGGVQFQRSYGLQQLNYSTNIFLEFCSPVQRSAIFNDNLILDTSERRNLIPVCSSSFFYVWEKTIRMKIIEKKKKNICKRLSFFHGFLLQGSYQHILKQLFSDLGSLFWWAQLGVSVHRVPVFGVLVLVCDYLKHNNFKILILAIFGQIDQF